VKPDNATGPAATVTNVVPDLSPYPLPPQVFEDLQALAAESDVLIVGEMHGTREVPRLIAELLPALAPLGYQGLALEIPADARDDLADWAVSDNLPVPDFFAAPNFDGRGNAEALALVRAALRPPNGAPPWQLLCFDATDDQPFAQWAERDAFMARNLATQQARLCPNGKVIVVCGNMHSRVTRKSQPDDWSHALWPSFAAALAEQNPHWAVRSVNVVFQAGTFYNMAVRTLGDPNRPPLPAPALVARPESEHTSELHLPRSTAASFLAPPSDLPEPQGEQ
jgi:hypothetical protein